MTSINANGAGTTHSAVLILEPTVPDTHLQMLVATLAATYFENNRVQPHDIPAVISTLARALADVSAEPRAPEPDANAAGPVAKTKAQVRRSITPDALISFEDGRPYKMLRKHLTGRGLTAEEYRRKHGLPADYPMVAPAASQARSDSSKLRGFGRKPEARTPQATAPGAGEPKRIKAKTSPAKAGHPPSEDAVPAPVAKPKRGRTQVEIESEAQAESDAPRTTPYTPDF